MAERVEGSEHSMTNRRSSSSAVTTVMMVGIERRPKRYLNPNLVAARGGDRHLHTQN
jgi:hypothetical protein